MKINLARLHLFSFIEGLSFLLLLCFAMPLKYIWGIPIVVKILGMVHGVLFVILVGSIVLYAKDKNFSLRKLFLALLTTSLPFGWQYLDDVFES